MSNRILVVDDDPQSLQSTKKILELDGLEVITAQNGEEALERVRQESTQLNLILTDVRMPRMGGLDFVKAMRVRGDRVPFILMTAFGQVDEAVWAMKMGAVDFLMKPIKRQSLLQAVKTALRRSQVGRSDSSDGILGKSKAAEELKVLIQQVAPTLATVLITGESGSGKERVAQALHRQSSRAKGPWVAMNCAAIPENLMESELFGYEKGAFTGATQAKPGLFEMASGGTLFLDEIGDMVMSLQTKLLRVLQEGEVRRLGSTQAKKVDVRILAATHQNLQNAVKEGRFRQDLLYRLEVIVLPVPSLKQRREDITELAKWFMQDVSVRHEKVITEISEDAIKALNDYSWPGNIRELSNVIERAVVLARGSILTLDDLPDHIRGGVGPKDFEMVQFKVGTPLKEMEDLLIRKTLEATDGDKEMTAKLLGIHSRTIYRKLEEKESPES